MFTDATFGSDDPLKLLAKYMVFIFVGNTVNDMTSHHPQGEMSEHEEVLPSGVPGHQALR